MRELIPFPPSWWGVHDAAKTRMGGVFFASDGEAFVWRWPFTCTLQHHLATTENPKGDITINDLKLAAHTTQLSLAAPWMQPLEHMQNATDNTASLAWAQ